MLIRHDPGEGVAYVYLTEESARVTMTQSFGGNFGTVNIDFDESGSVVGVEVLV
jgi:uncharacterized protein YuzE